MASKSNYFKKYNHIDSFVYLLNESINDFFINVHGNITDLKGSIIPYFKDEKGENWVSIKIKSIGNVEKEYRVSHLVQHTFKPTSLYLDQYEQVNVLFVDGNYNNLHPTNLVWQWVKLMDPLRPGFAIIPGASSYCISKDSVVILRATGRIIKPGIYEGYYCCKIQPDVGGRFKARVHRLKCLAWLEYPANVDSLDINHKDCIKANNDLSNLEWVTSKENNIHAILNGLQTNCIPVIVRHCFINRHTGAIQYELEKFASKADCGKRFNVDEVTIGRRIKTTPELLYIDLAKDRNTEDVLHGVQFKEDDGKNWPELTEDDDPYFNSQVLAKIKVRNVLTNKVTVHKDLSEAADFIGVLKQTLYYYLSKHRTYPISIYEIKGIHDTSSWLYFNNDQLLLLKMRHDRSCNKSQGFGYKIINIETDESRYFIDSNEVSNFLRVSKTEVNFKARTNKLINNWRIRQIHLEGYED